MLPKNSKDTPKSEREDSELEQGPALGWLDAHPPQQLAECLPRSASEAKVDVLCIAHVQLPPAAEASGAVCVPTLVLIPSPG